MKGSIRFAIGFFIVFGAVGGMDNQPGYLLEQTLAAILGLTMMLSGAHALDKAK
jgi:uncharacterized membrane protein